MLDIIERFTWGDSVFLADQLPSFSLPAYPNRPAFMGRWWWHLGRDVYQKILSGALALRRTTDPEQIAADRLEAVCAVTHLDTDVATIECLLRCHAADIDYVLVTPTTRHLKAKLEHVDGPDLIYSEDGFAIYPLGACKSLTDHRFRYRASVTLRVL